MTAVILLGHGAFPTGLRDAAELILGTQARLRSVGLAPDVSPEELRRTVAEEISDGDALLLVDVLGGTPSNVAAEIAARDGRVRVVAGANLPMVIEVLTARQTTAPELAAIAVTAGGNGVVDVTAHGES